VECEGRTGKFGYFNNYLIDTDHAVIVDVEATPARLAQEIIATKAMLERVEETHHLRPKKLAADKAYGTGPFLGWLSKRKIIRIFRYWIDSTRPTACCHARPLPSILT